jgi:hypothetical protein
LPRLRDDQVKGLRSSFLKKRTKKLLPLSVHVSAPVAQFNKSLFASFFPKKEALTFFLTR